jgi:hypothetical protein
MSCCRPQVDLDHGLTAPSETDLCADGSRMPTALHGDICALRAWKLDPILLATGVDMDLGVAQGRQSFSRNVRVLVRILAKSAGDSDRSRPLGLIEAGRAFW